MEHCEHNYKFTYDNDLDKVEIVIYNYSNFIECLTYQNVSAIISNDNNFNNIDDNDITIFEQKYIINNDNN